MRAKVVVEVEMEIEIPEGAHSTEGENVNEEIEAGLCGLLQGARISMRMPDGEFSPAIIHEVTADTR